MLSIVFSYSYRLRFTPFTLILLSYSNCNSICLRFLE